jgi:hypothetical protein
MRTILCTDPRCGCENPLNANHCARCGRALVASRAGLRPIGAPDRPRSQGWLSLLLIAPIVLLLVGVMLGPGAAFWPLLGLMTFTGGVLLILLVLASTG